MHNRRDAVHEVKTVLWKIGFTVPRFKQRISRFCATKSRLAVTPRYCNTHRALFHSISQIYRCIQFFSRHKRFYKEIILDLQILFPLKILKNFKLFVKNTLAHKKATYNFYIYRNKINIKFQKKKI